MNDLILFDLDGTLISGDSDHEWGNFMCDVGAVDEKEFREKNQAFYKQYVTGNLDMHEYLKFALQPFAQHSIEKMHAWREMFIESRIKPMITPENKMLIMKYKQSGDTTVIITSTNRFITEPIAEIFKVDDLIATELETVRGKFTGSPSNIPCFREGKVSRLQQWLSKQSVDYEKIWFYSDSINDLPLLEYVDKPMIKNGDPEITEIAKKRSWALL